MGSDSRVGVNEKAAGFGADSIEQTMRERIRETIEQLVEEELEAALGAANSQRVGAQRTGYRHGERERTLTTSLGPATFAMPRARVSDRDGRGRECEALWRRVTSGAPNASVRLDPGQTKNKERPAPLPTNRSPSRPRGSVARAPSRVPGLAARVPPRRRANLELLQGVG